MAGTTVNPYRFGGQIGYRRDASDRLYIRERHLDTSKGRWISRDPIAIAAADLNFYWYVKNNPPNFIDPSGNMPPAYGQYCGPQTYVPPPPTGPYNKQLDKCCQQHDNCWGKHGCKFPGGWYYPSPACRKCNTALCNCTKGVSCGKDLGCQGIVNIVKLSVCPPPPPPPHKASCCLMNYGTKVSCSCVGTGDCTCHPDPNSPVVIQTCLYLNAGPCC